MASSILKIILKALSEKMFICVFIAKFINENKKNIAETIISSLGKRFKDESKLQDLIVPDIRRKTSKHCKI